MPKTDSIFAWITWAMRLPGKGALKPAKSSGSRVAFPNGAAEFELKRPFLAGSGRPHRHTRPSARKRPLDHADA